jgi:hypothetical protein
VGESQGLIFKNIEIKKNNKDVILRKVHLWIPSGNNVNKFR